MLRQLGLYEAAVAREHREGAAAEASRRRRVLASLRPGGALQERELSILPFVARHGEAIKAHFDAKPSGRHIDAIQASLEGMGMNVPQFNYTGVRNEEALASARRRYGDAVVDWMLEREGTVASMLRP